MRRFTLIKQVDGEVPVYGGQTAATGDVVALDGLLADKAAANPDFREVIEAAEPKQKAEPKAKAEPKQKAE